MRPPSKILEGSTALASVKAKHRYKELYMQRAQAERDHAAWVAGERRQTEERIKARTREHLKAMKRMDAELEKLNEELG